jgi:transketolase
MVSYRSLHNQMTKEEKREYNKRYKASHREYFRNAQRTYREAHPEYAKTWQREHRRMLAKFLRQYKAEHPCILCGQDDVTKLDFHHRLPVTKCFNVSRPSGTISMQTLLEEIAKCDVLCQPCHMRRHKLMRFAAP